METKDASVERPKGGDALERVLDGTFAPLTFLNPGPDGQAVATERRIKIRKVAMTKMDLLGAAWGKMAQEAVVYTGLTAAEVETLTPESFCTVIEEGRRLNFTSFGKWFEFQKASLDALGNAKGGEELLAKAMTAAAEAVVSQQLKNPGQP